MIDSITGDCLTAQVYEINYKNKDISRPTYPPVTNMLDSEYLKIAEDYVKFHNLMSGEIAKCEITTLNEEGISPREKGPVGSSEVYGSVVEIRVTDSNGAKTDIHITKYEKKVCYVYLIDK